MFTRMDQSTKQEWEHISEQHMPHIFDMPNRIMGMLKQLQSLNPWIFNGPTSSCTSNCHNGKASWCRG